MSSAGLSEHSGNKRFLSSLGRAGNGLLVAAGNPESRPQATRQEDLHKHPVVPTRRCLKTGEKRKVLFPSVGHTSEARLLHGGLELRNRSEDGFSESMRIGGASRTLGFVGCSHHICSDRSWLVRFLGSGDGSPAVDVFLELRGGRNPSAGRPDPARGCLCTC